MSHKTTENQIRDAIDRTAAELPNHTTDIHIRDPDGAHELLRMSANYNELPAIRSDGSLAGWHPTYRTREEFEAKLTDELPAGVSVEWENSHETIFYTEQ